MNEKLKLQLLGGGALVILLVIVVPLFFEDKSKHPESEKTVIQSTLPTPGLSKPDAPPADEAVDQAETPASAGAGQSLQPGEEKEEKKKAPDRYKVLSLDDPEPAGNHPATGSMQKPGRKNELASDAEKSESPAAVQLPAPGKKLARDGVLTGEQKHPVDLMERPVTRPVGQEPAFAPENRKPLPSENGHRPFPGSTVTSANQPHKPPPAAEPAVHKNAAKPVENGSAWRVQAGSFAQESNARNLAEKLRKRNLPVQVTVASGTSGPIYRVVVGQHLSRSRAEEIQRQIDTQENVKGIVLHGR